MKLRFQIMPAAIACCPAAAACRRVKVVLLASCLFSLAASAPPSPQPDGYGKSCGAATALGYLTKGQSIMRQGTLQAAAVEDWFSVSFAAGTALTITVQNAPAMSDGGTDFQLEVIPSCGAPAIATAQGGPDLKQVTLGDNAPRTVILRVRAGNWKAAHPMFKLAVSAQEAVPPRPLPIDRKPIQHTRP